MTRIRRARNVQLIPGNPSLAIQIVQLVSNIQQRMDTEHKQTTHVVCVNLHVVLISHSYNADPSHKEVPFVPGFVVSS